jgi:ankyrin repeat protein
VNARSAHHFEWTPLHFASSHGHVKVVQLLTGHGADINAQSTSHSTPLKFATWNQHLEVAQLLLEHGAVKE